MYHCKFFKIRITNVRRRIIRMGRVCAIFLLLLVALHMSSENVGVDSMSALISESQPAYFKFHRNVYPILKSELGNFEPRNLIDVSGPGEKGQPYYMSQDRANHIVASESEYGMNVAASDVIALNRSIPDTRIAECKYWHYPEELPSTSVIIVFHNEGFSVLMRAVHSVIDRSPPNILHEIVLVDDFSDKENLKENLDNYIKRWKGKVRLIRNSQREGLIRTRSRGAQEATGEVIVFLDAHCEVNLNWLPPLLTPIYRDYSTMTVPIIDDIDHRNFEYKLVYRDRTNHRGVFEWGLLYKEIEMPEREASLHKYSSEPYKSPTHAGGPFAMNRKYFLEIGAYDLGLLVLGSENLELNFKIWQCGGSVEWVPCSRVGHIYRVFTPYSFGNLAKNRKGSLNTINKKRIVETWFDEEHKEYFYTREPMARSLDMGDINEQVALRERLKCKSFGWFMENVAYDVYVKFPKLPNNIHWGMVKNKATSVCLDTLERVVPAEIGTSTCHEGSSSQLFRLNGAGQLGVGEHCVKGDANSISQDNCRIGTVDGPWRFDDEYSHLVHRLHDYCLTIQPHSKQLGLAPCDPNNIYQQWIIFHQESNEGD